MTPDLLPFVASADVVSDLRDLSECAIQHLAERWMVQQSLACTSGSTIFVEFSPAAAIDLGCIWDLRMSPPANIISFGPQQKRFVG